MKILDKIEFENSAIILEDYKNKEIPKEGFRNLYSVNSTEIVWRAELVPNSPFDAYVRIELNDGKLVGYTNYHKVKINPRNGRILEYKNIW